MKIPALVAALALAGTSAFATQSNSADTHRAQTNASADAPKGDGMMDKTKRALHNMGDKMRATGHKIGKKVDQYDHRDDKTEHAARNDHTRTMGAPGADTPENARRSRMDEAYANSKKRQQQP